MSETTTGELDEQLELCRQRFRRVLEQIRTVLAEDLRSFPTRAAKRAFLERTDVAERMSDDDVRRLKERAEGLGPKLAERVDEHLADESLWLTDRETPEDTRSLEAVAEVWERVRTAEEESRELLEPFGLADAETVRYKPPRYFVRGLYLPSLMEHYWRLMGEMDELRAQKRALDEETVRDRLQARWEEA